MRGNLISANDLSRPEIEKVLGLAGSRISLANIPVWILSGGSGYLEFKEILTDMGTHLVNSPDPSTVILVENRDEPELSNLAASNSGGVVNAGNASENPLAALTVLCAIRRAKGTLDGLRIGLLGNLRSDPITHSLVRLFTRFDVRLSFISPAALSMPYDLTDEVRAAGIEIEETNDLSATLPKLDVIHLARVDAGTVDDRLYQKLKALYPFSPTVLSAGKSDLYLCGEWQDAAELLTLFRGSLPEMRRAVLTSLISYLISPS